MNRTMIENILIDMGVPAGIKGFNYIADAVEYIDEHGADISVTKELYPGIAKRRKTTEISVERAIRHAFEVARSERGDYEVVNKYIGFMHCTNSDSISMLYKKIKQECNKTDIENQKEEKVEKTTAEITELKIREIFRQELRMVLNELKESVI